MFLVLEPGPAVAAFIIGGVGSTKFVDQEEADLNFGFGFRVFLTDYASLQLDLRDHIFSLDLLGKNNSTQNIELTPACPSTSESRT